MKQSSKDASIGAFLIALGLLMIALEWTVLGFSLMIMSVISWLLSIAESRKESMEMEMEP